MKRLPLVIAAAAVAMLSSAANAHPKLLSATPAANSSVVRPSHIDLRFSEKLMPAFSKADLVMAAMPGMAAMNIASTAVVAPDGRSLVITPKAPLHSGRYNVVWHVVSTDTHKVAGNFVFAVK
ncbi:MULTISPECIES: copper homeostasis periplasmic binding protein CopC [Sphingomonas]|uniref:copper homeostasis periplasmic binding protein CopC n=1 Tax=Sphingomonas TaxID=13687 RepID=UPI000DEEF08D|nr:MULTISPECIES: copper homeostasis periplasmic binding protein CopC [Sphingomonas]